MISKKQKCNIKKCYYESQSSIDLQIMYILKEIILDEELKCLDEK